ncbi:hypothetical protein KKD52_13420 [Myxococcota bacterium]|nr:hypothetical protein [Myxococcota bacterium]MBU1511354.1 hypothetical protein [Myxococcota bacterium]
MVAQKFKFLLLTLLAVSCRKTPADPASATAQATGSDKPAAVAQGVTRRYAFLTADYRGVPVPLLERPADPSAPFEVQTLPDGRIERIRKLDTERRELESWTFTWDEKKNLTELVRADDQGTVQGRLSLEWMEPKVCVNLFGPLGRQTERSCFTIASPQKVEQVVLNPHNVTLQKKRLETDGQGLVRRIVTQSRQGLLQSVELQQVMVQNDQILMKYQKLAPQGAVELWQESRYDSAGRLVLIAEKYEDGAIKSQTTYEYKSPFSAVGRAITLEGTELTLEVKLDRFGHRILERRFDGPRLVEEELSEYDAAGRPVLRRVLDENQVVQQSERWTRDAAGLVTEYEKYRGNLHNFECRGPTPEQRVATKLPALEKARMQYDALGRVTRLERIYLHQPVDTETVTYGRNSLVTSREIRISDEPEPLRTEYEYDAVGNLLKAELFQGKNRTEILQYEYSASGQLVKQTLLKGDGTPPSAQEWPDGSVVQYYYDNSGKLTEERWSHADGKPALTTRSVACESCSGNNRKNAVSRITWKFNEIGQLVQKQDFGDGAEPLFEATSTYDAKGRELTHQVRWPREKKTTRLSTSYAPGGWALSTEIVTELDGKEVTKETRQFDRALLVRVEKFKNGQLERRVERRYEKGRMVERRVTSPREGTVSVQLIRDPAGLVVEEKGTNEKGQAAVAQDIFENQYTSLVSTYSPKHQIVSATMIHEPTKKITRSEFSYDNIGRPTGRKVFVNQKLTMELEERFDHPFLGPYGIATAQVRATVSEAGVREVTTYQIHVDTAKLKNSSATLTLPGQSPLLLTDCRCSNCGLTVTMGEF